MTLIDRFGLDGKAALVVGGGYGIGRETALLLAEAGARVAVADVDRERAASVADEVDGVAIVGDVTDPDGAWRVVDEAHEQLGGLDRVANIVGLATFVEDVFAIDTEVWEHDLRMNLAHHLDVSRAAAPPHDRRRHRRRAGAGRVGQRVLRRRPSRRLRRREGRGDVVGPGDGERVGSSRHPRQLRRAGRHPDAAAGRRDGHAAGRTTDR